MSAPPDEEEQSSQPSSSSEPPASLSPPVPAGDSERAPGWYPDPDGSGWRRYWDGQAWTSASAEQLAGEAGSPDAERRRAPARIIVAVAVLVAAAAVALLASGSSSHRHRAASAVTPAPGAVRAASATTSASVTATTMPPVTAADVHAAINAYVAAYNARSITAMTALFSPQLVRRSGNGHPENLAGALGIYRGQFATETNPDLRLVGIHIARGVGQATAGALFGVYEHHQRTRGTIAFHFTQSGSQLLIDQLVVRSRPAAAGGVP